MTQNQIVFTDEANERLEKIQALLSINGKKTNNKSLLIDQAIEIAYNSIINLDEESLINITGLKKSI